jgi:glycosyltransferase involved in cell wall biosynthesis
LKILYHHRIRSRDGQAVHLEELVAALRGRGHEILIVGPEAFAGASFGHEPKLLTQLKRFAPNKIYEALELGYNVLAGWRLYRACRRFRPDFIYERCNLYLLAGILCGRAVGVPLVLEVNSPLARERKSFGGLGFPRIAASLERWTWRNADAVLPVTQVLAEEIRAGGVESNRIAVVPNAIDPQKFAAHCDGAAAKIELGLVGKLVLGFTGFVRDWHGLDAIVALLAQPGTPPDLHMLIVGEGPAIADLKTQSGQLGVAHRVTFAGLVDRDRVANYVAAFDIALVPRCVDYCSPLKLFEYMAASKAIVAPDQANIREILVSGESAVLFEPDAPQAMADAILGLANDDALRGRLGSAALSLVSLQNYTWPHNAERVSAIGAGAARKRTEHDLNPSR